MNVTTQHLIHLLIPGDGGALQSRLYISVSAAEVNNDEVEVGVSGYSEQIFHLRDEMIHPPSLVFHWKRQRK